MSTLDFRMPNQLPREEPTQQRSFGPDYAGYCGHVSRWRPRVGAIR